ncbi:hypothetical protein Aave_1347 [Paracidovorax citrulli AAC00-1]|uniref:Uncharacterized protein n=1 Tax=Paracidovorax citrulli (strain AAC00-1) TaxID=397945 RepID=A1TLV0_PARC0|nr:hypothetical protein Aave_1347 [Paracidovorax citrulli AAC00-1]
MVQRPSGSPQGCPSKLSTLSGDGTQARRRRVRICLFGAPGAVALAFDLHGSFSWDGGRRDASPWPFAPRGKAASGGP